MVCVTEIMNEMTSKITGMTEIMIAMIEKTEIMNEMMTHMTGVIEIMPEC